MIIGFYNHRECPYLVLFWLKVATSAYQHMSLMMI